MERILKPLSGVMCSWNDASILRGHGGLRERLFKPLGVSTFEITPQVFEGVGVFRKGAAKCIRGGLEALRLRPLKVG